MEQPFSDSSVAAASKTTCTGPSFRGVTTPATVDLPLMLTAEPPHPTSRPLTVMLLRSRAFSPRPLARIRSLSNTASWMFTAPRTRTVSRYVPVRLPESWTLWKILLMICAISALVIWPLGFKRPSL